MTERCPSCSAPASGRFCGSCGVALAGATCASCDAELPPGGRYCDQCGTPVPAAKPASEPEEHPTAPAGRGSRVPWIISGVAFVLLAGFFLLDELGGDDPAPAMQDGTGGRQALAPPAVSGGAAPDVDLSDMRGAADRLFARIMQHLQSGDTSSAAFFLPMAIQAYGSVPDLEPGERYRLAMLHLLSGNPEGALTQADSILQVDPDHLLGLYTAARANQTLGREDEANRLYARFEEVYPGEIATARPDYETYAPVLEMMRRDAREFSSRFKVQGSR